MSEIDKQQIDRLYELMEREKGDQDMTAALRWAIFQLEQMGREKQTGDLVFRLAVDVKYADIMMLNPTNGIAVKYNFNPVTAIRCNCTFCSLLNTLTIGLADNKKIKYMPHDITNIVFKAYFKICF